MSWEGFAAVVLPVITAFGTWYATRRKATAQARALELKNTLTEVGAWRDLVEEYKADLASRNNELTEVKNQLTVLIKKSLEQTRQIIKLEALIEGQNRIIAELKKDNK